ncbi:hypothetical protein [Bordetella sp. LUAb4]|uniref:hypothetical protein n=1 Tax=Bordetella sp. LUAb4 TaxID=2843195 RepID=UPI001E5CD9DD|nr:hypothetical protein [Bordetella sp. LUAb4]
MAHPPLQQCGSVLLCWTTAWLVAWAVDLDVDVPSAAAKVMTLGPLAVQMMVVTLPSAAATVVPAKAEADMTE